MVSSAVNFSFSGHTVWEDTDLQGDGERDPVSIEPGYDGGEKLVGTTFVPPERLALAIRIVSSIVSSAHPTKLPLLSVDYMPMSQIQFAIRISNRN